MSAVTPLTLAILISGRGSNMTAITRACLAGEINARVAVVIADRADAAGLAGARDLGADTATVLRPSGTPAEVFERELAACVGAAHVVACANGMIWGPAWGAAITWISAGSRARVS